MKIIKYYKNALLIPSIFVISSQIIWGLFNYDPNYKSEWLTPGTIFIWSIAIVILNIIFISILSLPIFFNKKADIRNNLNLSLLTWVLLPMVWLVYLTARAVLLFFKNNSINSDILFLLLNVIPFIIGLIWSFLKFRQVIKSNPYQNK